MLTGLFPASADAENRKYSGFLEVEILLSPLLVLLVKCIVWDSIYCRITVNYWQQFRQ